MTDRVREKVDRQLRYNMVKWKKTGEFDILNDISDYVALVQLVYTAGNANHAVSIIECWIYDFNYKRAPPLIKESLDIIFSPSKYYKVMYEEFKYVHYAVM